MIYYYTFFILIATLSLIFSSIKFIKIINFNIKMKKNYYKEIPGYFEKFFWNKANTGQELIFGKTHATPIFTYKIDNEEFILRGVKVLPNTYKSGQKVTLYQNPKSGKIFENPNNAKAEAISFIVATFFLLILIIFAFCVIKY